MRTRVLFFWAVVLMICILLVLFWAAKHEQPIHTETTMTVTNQPANQPEPPRPVENRLASNTLRTLLLPSSASPLAKALAITNLIAARQLAQWQAPIEFYGKVVDENSNAVAGAKVDFHWVEIPAEDGNRTTNTESDTEGLFSLHGQLGPYLSVSVSKDGYYASHHWQRGFNYSLGPDIISPDPQNPVVFILRKKGQGAELITSDNGMQPDVYVRIPKDNTPVRVDLLQKKVSAAGRIGDQPKQAALARCNELVVSHEPSGRRFRGE